MSNRNCWLSVDGKHRIQRVFIGPYEHYQCVHCGQTSWIKLDGEFAWEGFRGLAPTEAAQQGTQEGGK